MRKSFFSTNPRHVVVALIATFLSVSCQEMLEGGSPSYLTLCFDEDSYALTRSSSELPDTNDFHVIVSDASGKKMYDGLYHAMPAVLEVKAGSYSVEAVSGEFKSPSFDSPVYGDVKTVVVKSGETAGVSLLCRQTNAGIRLAVESSFRQAYPAGVLWLKSDDGRLMYSATEKRYAFFSPGSVQLVMTGNSPDQVLWSRSVKASQMIELSVAASSQGAGGQNEGRTGVDLSISVDTSREYLSENVIAGGNSTPGSGTEDALNIAKAMENIGAEDVWVYGYIAGGNMTQAKIDFEGPFSSRTNLAIASKSTETDRERCMGVALPSGKIRDALNLVDNPGNKGRKVYIKGDIVESYYGIPGIKNVSDFRL